MPLPIVKKNFLKVLLLMLSVMVVQVKALDADPEDYKLYDRDGLSFRYHREWRAHDHLKAFGSDKHIMFTAPALDGMVMSNNSVTIDVYFKKGKAPADIPDTYSYLRALNQGQGILPVSRKAISLPPYKGLLAIDYNQFVRKEYKRTIIHIEHVAAQIFLSHSELATTDSKNSKPRIDHFATIANSIKINQ